MPLERNLLCLWLPLTTAVLTTNIDHMASYKVIHFVERNIAVNRTCTLHGQMILINFYGNFSPEQSDVATVLGPD